MSTLISFSTSINEFSVEDFLIQKHIDGFPDVPVARQETPAYCTMHVRVIVPDYESPLRSLAIAVRLNRICLAVVGKFHLVVLRELLLQLFESISNHNFTPIRI